MTTNGFVDTLTQRRVDGTRAFLDYLLYAVIEREVTITTSDELTNIIRACYAVNTKIDNSKARQKSTILNNRQEFNKVLLNKEGLEDIITVDVNSFVSDVKNYLS